jgi:excisionase family DNA binding protein
LAERSFLTVEEVARALRVHENTVRVWLRAGQLQGVRLAREWRVSEKDLERFLVERRQPIPPEVST